MTTDHAPPAQVTRFLPEVDFPPSYIDRVYFIQAASGPIKIGRTNQVQTALNWLQEKTWDELVLVGWMEDRKNLESELHGRFADAYIRGGWFWPVPELIAFINAAMGRGTCVG